MLRKNIKGWRKLWKAVKHLLSLQVTPLAAVRLRKNNWKMFGSSVSATFPSKRLFLIVPPAASHKMQLGDVSHLCRDVTNGIRILFYRLPVMGRKKPRVKRRVKMPAAFGEEVNRRIVKKDFLGVPGKDKCKTIRELVTTDMKKCDQQ